MSSAEWDIQYLILHVLKLNIFSKSIIFLFTHFVYIGLYK